MSLHTLTRAFTRLAIPNNATISRSHIASSSRSTITSPNLPLPIRSFTSTPSTSATLQQVLRHPRKQPPKKTKTPLLDNGSMQKKGVCSKVFTTKPKKPNSAIRKVCRVKLSNGETTTCYIPGEGHNLQEHSVVLVRGGRVRDLPGVKYKVMRGSEDLGAIAGRVRSRSKYGTKKPKTA